jgi:hypothetical protein
MKNIIAITAALTLSAGAAFAQTTTQQAVLGQSENAAYPVQVQGTNGVIYNCSAQIVSIDGVRARRCIQAGSGGLFDAGTGLATGAAVGAGALVLLALANDDDNNSTTTTGSNG